MGGGIAGRDATRNGGLRQGTVLVLTWVLAGMMRRQMGVPGVYWAQMGAPAVCDWAQKTAVGAGEELAHHHYEHKGQSTAGGLPAEPPDNGGRRRSQAEDHTGSSSVARRKKRTEVVDEVDGVVVAADAAAADVVDGC